MLMPDPQHLTADELDLLLIGTTAPRATSHLETCAACRSMVLLDHQVVTALAALPMLNPRADFADRIMRQVSTAPKILPQPSLLPTPRERSARRRLIAGGLFGGSLVTAGFAWASANPALALGWVNPSLSNAGRSLWLSLQTLSANFTEQPWYSVVSGTFATPMRIVLTAAAVAGLYAAALVGFRQLLTEPATDAGW